MPIYAYRCQECHEVMEVLHRSQIVHPESCQKCGAAEPKRILSAVAAHVGSSEPVCGSGQCGMQPMGPCGGGGCGAGSCAF